jgi:hypothetical protein
MRLFAKSAICAVLLFGFTAAAQTATIRSVTVLGGSNPEVEILGSAPLTPAAQVITGPDRLVIDFPNSVPGPQLRSIDVNKGELKSVRVGRFSSQPPVTRVVLDLKAPQPYQLFPSGKSLIVKLQAAGSSISAMPAAPSASAPVPVIQKPAPRVQVDFKNGELKIWANRAPLAEVLNEVHRRTGAELSLPPGAGQELVVANLGPAAPRDVMAALLNGSSFNFVMVSSEQNPGELKSILLTTRGSGPENNTITYPAVTSAAAADGMQPQQYEPPPDQPLPQDQPPPDSEAPPQSDAGPNPPPPQEENPPQQENPPQR